MNAWLHLFLGFTMGFILGAAFIFLELRSKLKFYKQFIEHRLSAVYLAGPPFNPGAAR